MIAKPQKRSFSNRAHWSRTRKEFLTGKADHRGYYQCAKCRNWYAEVDIDHIVKRSVDPSRVYDLTNLQILCRICHIKKDGGMNAT